MLPAVVFGQAGFLFYKEFERLICVIILTVNSGRIAIEVGSRVALKPGQVYFPNMAKTVIKLTEKS